MTGHALYMGTIEVDVEVTHNIIEPGYVVKRLNHSEVLDEYAEARAALLARHPNISAERVQKGLLTPMRGMVPRAVTRPKPR